MLAKFGYPNDEALSGHPLYSKGLGFYGTFEVIGSSWARNVVAQNRVVFPSTSDDYAGRHFIVTFHDSMFECLAHKLEAELTTKNRSQIVGGLSRQIAAESA